MLLSELAESMELSPARTVIRILDETDGKVKAIYFSMSDRDVEEIMSREDIVTGSDGCAMDFDSRTQNGLPHPRNFGTFPRTLRMGREIGRPSREKIIRKMTGLPAGIFRLKDTGSICVGNYADITVFDWDRFRDTATYDRPYQKPVGLKHVIVSGSLILEDGKITRNSPGRILGKGTRRHKRH
jgi:N-acyl-D-amino-acid deacylase